MQGCNFQLFALFILLDMAKNLNKTLYICLLDYEKAFDFVNRVEMIKQLMKLGIGSKFLRSLRSMYLEKLYVPKISMYSIGEEFSTDYGITQGKDSSANIFSSYISDIPQSIRPNNPPDFMDSYNIIQLADDSSILV